MAKKTTDASGNSIQGCTITDVGQLFQADLTKEVAQSLFAILDKQPTSGYLAQENTMRDKMKESRSLLASGKKLSETEYYEYLAVFLESKFIQRAFTYIINKYIKQGRVVPGNAHDGTEHATCIDGKPSVEKITQWLREQKLHIDSLRDDVIMGDGIQAMCAKAVDSDLSHCEKIASHGLQSYYKTRGTSWDGDKFIEKCSHGAMYVLRHNNQIVGFYRIDTDPNDDSVRHIAELHIAERYRNV